VLTYEACFANLTGHFFGGGKSLFQRLAIHSVLLLLLLSSFAWSAQKHSAAPARADKKATSAQESNSLNPPDGSHINNPRPTISAEYEDEGVGINTLSTKLSVDGEDVTSSAQSESGKISYRPLMPLPDGVHKVKLDIFDEAGNLSTATWTFTLHTQPPEIKILSHKLVQYVNQSPIVVTGTLNDARGRVEVNGIAAKVEGGNFKATVDIAEGKNTIIAEATDSYGNTGHDYVAVILDSKQPEIAITSHPLNSLVDTRVVTISGLVGEKTSVTLIVNAGQQPIPVETENGTFTAKGVRLNEGPNIITAKAVSSAGNVGTSTINITVDTTPPNIAITVPRNMAMTNKKTITVSGTVDDPTAVVEVNNAPVQVSKGSFTLSSVNLAEGENAITATAVDPAGNRAKSAIIIVVLKTTHPATPSFTEMPSSTRHTVIVVQGTAEPGSQVEIFRNNRSTGSVRADENGLFSLKTTLAEGKNVFTAVAADAVGNASAPSATVSVFLDTKPPRIL
jgi:large repetitive protein